MGTYKSNPYQGEKQKTNVPAGPSRGSLGKIGLARLDLERNLVFLRSPYFLFT
jgi:hypothetical protein